VRKVLLEQSVSHISLDCFFGCAQTIVQLYIQLLTVKLALIVYDTLLTLPHEIEFVWKQKLRLAALLYFMIHYPAIPYFLIGTLANT
jgi:hypothetical protein